MPSGDERVFTCTHGARRLCQACASACTWCASSPDQRASPCVLAQFQAARKAVDKGEGGGGREASAGGGRGAEEEFGAKVAVLGNVERC